MLNKKISNPLTVIAIFAGLAQTSGTGVLVLLDGPIQKIFIWFVMFFPITLVILFFYILYKYPKNLYSPSDYSNEELFFKAVIESKESTNEVLENSLNQLTERFGLEIGKLLDNGGENISVPREKLETLLDNLIASSEKNRQLLFEKKPNLMMHESTIDSDSAKKLVENMNEVFELNCHNSDFSIQDLASEMQISTSTLNRKTKMIFNTSASILLNTFRLNKAKKLIEKGEEMSEILSKVGFSSQSFFAKRFKDEFGVSPYSIAVAADEPIQ